MKILPSFYSTQHSFAALKRLHKSIIRKKINLGDLHRVYSAMLHLERYNARLDADKRHNSY